MPENTSKMPASQTKKWWGARNARRRERYAQDATYRAEEIDRSRANYRDRNGSPATNDISRGNAGQYGVLRQIGVRPRKVLTFTIKELAKVLGYNSQIMGRWVRDDRMPAPIFEAGHLKVYKYAEVRAIISVLSDHLKNTAYYRSDHHGTRSRMIKAVEEARSK